MVVTTRCLTILYHIQILYSYITVCLIRSRDYWWQYLHADVDQIWLVPFK